MNNQLDAILIKTKSGQMKTVGLGVPKQQTSDKVKPAINNHKQVAYPCRDLLVCNFLLSYQLCKLHFYLDLKDGELNRLIS